MKLIPQWRKAWRMFTVQISLLTIVWVALPSWIQADFVGLIGVPADLVPGILALITIAARLIAQPKLA